MQDAVKEEVVIVKELNDVASKHPYYKYVQVLRRTHGLENTVLTDLQGITPNGREQSKVQSAQPSTARGWAASAQTHSQLSSADFSLLRKSVRFSQVRYPLNAAPSPYYPYPYPLHDKPHPSITAARLTNLFWYGIVPTNIKDRDAFHFTIEEYLLSLTDLTPELARLATNAVTLGDFELPMTISAFIKDIFAGFQLLNLKNDILRKRADAVKYDVKKVEDVVYDLSLRGLVARPGANDTEMKTAE